MSKELFSRIITQDKVRDIPVEIVHFYHPPEGLFLDIPLNLSGIELEEVREVFGKYDCIADLVQNKVNLSANVNMIIEIVEKLGLRNFLIEHIDDMDWAMYEFIQLVVKDGQIIKGSTQQNTDEEGDLYSSIYLGYDYTDYIYKSYVAAVQKYKNGNSRLSK